jgi:hypothetical protein
MRTFSNYDDWSSACGKTGLVTRQIAGYQQYEAFDEDAFAIEPPMPRRKSNVMS